MNYRIKIRGKIDESWSECLGGAKIASELDENGEMITTLTVRLADQPALFGILDRIRDMNLLPVAIERMDREK
jgi:hypothetical protein